jgi:hypothetical protein
MSRVTSDLVTSSRVDQPVHSCPRACRVDYPAHLVACRLVSTGLVVPASPLIGPPPSLIHPRTTSRPRPRRLPPVRLGQSYLLASGHPVTTTRANVGRASSPDDTPPPTPCAPLHPRQPAPILIGSKPSRHVLSCPISPAQLVPGARLTDWPQPRLAWFPPTPTGRPVSRPPDHAPDRVDSASQTPPSLSDKPALLAPARPVSTIHPLPSPASSTSLARVTSCLRDHPSQAGPIPRRHAQSGRSLPLSSRLPQLRLRPTLPRPASTYRTRSRPHHLVSTRLVTS